MRSAFDIVANVMVQGLDSIKDLIGEVKRLGSVADKTGEKIDNVGDTSKRTAKNVRPLRDRLQDLGTMFRDSGDAGGRFGDILDMVAVATTPAGAGIVGLVAIVGGATVALQAGAAMWSIYVENVSSARAQVDETSSAFDRLVVSIMDVTGAGGALTTALAGVERLAENTSNDIDALTATARENDGILGTLARGTLVALRSALFAVTGAAAPLVGLVLFAGAQEQTRQLEQELNILNNTTNTVGGAMVSLANDVLKLVDASAQLVAQEEALAFVQQMRAAAGAGGGVQGPLTPGGTFVAPVKRRRGGGGGRRGKSRAERLQESSGALVDEMMGDLLQDPAFLASIMPEAVVSPMLTAGLGAMDAAQVATDTAMIADEVAGLIGVANEAADAQKKLNDEFDRLGQESMATGINAMNQLGSAVAQTMGAFMAGTSTLHEFGDAMADLASRVAADFGSLFVKMGAGFLFTPGMQGVGAGLIAAGLGLQVLSGFLGGKGSGNRVSGGGRAGSASAARDIAREVNRSLRPSGDDGPMVTNIEVVIGGRSIQPEMVSIIDDIARQRRSRYLGRRMGV
jgi:hypothetical protein